MSQALLNRSYSLIEEETVYNSLIGRTSLCQNLSLIRPFALFESISELACPGGAHDQIFVAVRLLLVCWCGAPSLMRERVCHLQLLLVLASTVILWPESHGTHDHILLIRDPPNLEAQVHVFISPRNRVAQLYPQALGSLCVASTTRRPTVDVFDPALIL
jgi:hypothetical protein